MGKHTSDTLSQTSGKAHNKAGGAPQAPLAKSTDKNNYR
jgi:hypothetical protein